MINNITYNIIADKIAQAQKMAAKIQDLLTDIDTTLTNSQLEDDYLKRRLDSTNEKVYTDISNQYFYGQGMLSFVAALQKHVIRYYGSIDVFYDIYSITVEQEFADVSNAAGYLIKSKYIV